MNIEDPRLEPIAAKALAGELLGFEDALALYRTHDLLGVGQIADGVRAERHGHRAWCVVDLNGPKLSAEGTEGRIQTLLSHPAADVYEPPLRAHLSGHTYLKDVAVARLLLPQVIHIRVRLCAQVENVCQIALRFGADTLAGANLEELQRQARAAGCELPPS
jgi:2-iminoacetate synthase ThiH